MKQHPDLSSDASPRLKAALLSPPPADRLPPLSILLRHQLFKSCRGCDVKGGQAEHSESFFFKDGPTASSAITLFAVKYVCIFNIEGGEEKKKKTCWMWLNLSSLIGHMQTPQQCAGERYLISLILPPDQAPTTDSCPTPATFLFIWATQTT